MKSNGRLLACGGIAGELSLKDSRTMKTEHAVDAYRGLYYDHLILSVSYESFFLCSSLCEIMQFVLPCIVCRSF